MTKKYQFHYQLPSGSQAIQKLVFDTKEKIITNYNDPKGIHLSLKEGLSFVLITGASPTVSVKLAYEPGKVCPCYASAITHLKIDDRDIYFPYGGEDTIKANMFLVDSPEVRVLEGTDVDHISEVTGYHAPFLPKHKEGRYIGTAFERASLILDFLGHLTLLKINYNIMGGFSGEFIDWTFRAAGLSHQDFLNQLQDVANGLSVEKHIAPFFEDEDTDKQAS